MAWDPDVLFSGRGADPIEVALFLLGESEKAWRVSEGGDDADVVWLPKSQCTIVERVSTVDGEVVTFAVPEWLAIKNGLV